MMERIRQRKGEEGLTLIEILVVIIVLGILAGIVIFGISTFREDTAATACQVDGKSVETASEAFKAKTTAYPADLDALTGAGYLKDSDAISGDTMTKDGYTVTIGNLDGVVTGTTEGGTPGDCYESAPAPAPSSSP